MNFSRMTALLLIVSILGCSEFIEGDKKKESVLRLNNDQFACLNQAPEVIRQVFSETSRPEKVVSVLECFEKSLAYFIKRTKGTVPDGYSVHDVRAFFGNYLGDRDRVTDEMANEMMKIKRALFGGSDQVIAKSELQGLIDFLTLLRKEVTVLEPHWDLLLFKTGMRPDRQSLALAHLALRDSVTRLVLKTKLVQTEYSFQDFKNLTHEVEKFVQRSPDQKSVNFMKWLPVAESMKIHLFSDRADMGTAARWKEAVRIVIECYKVYSLYRYQFKGFDFYTPQAFRAGSEIFEISIRILNDSWWMDKGGIPFIETENLLKKLSDLKVVPKEISVAGLMELYKGFVKNLLDRGSPEDAVKLRSLERQHIVTLKSEYRSLRGIQTFIDSISQNLSSVANPYQLLLQQLNNRTTIQVDVFNETSDELLQSAWVDWKTHLNQPLPLSFLPGGALVLDRKVKESQTWTWETLTRLNVMRFLNRVLFLSFGKSRSMTLSRETLEEKGMFRFYSDFWIFGTDIQAFDKRSGNSGKRSFFEGDHFLYASNGDKQMQLQEGFELINVIFSAGLSGLSRLQERLSHSSCALPETDFFEKNWVDENCLSKLLRAELSTYFGNLPGLVKWAQGLDDEEWDQFYQEVIRFSRMDAKVKGKLETGDLRTLVVILHYVESMYLRFDLDQDDRLSMNELGIASERFAPFFKETFHLKPKGKWFLETQEKAISFAISKGFACLVATGEMPTLKNCTVALVRDWTKSKPYSDRALIIRTLNAFKAAL